VEFGANALLCAVTFPRAAVGYHTLVALSLRLSRASIASLACALLCSLKSPALLIYYHPPTFIRVRSSRRRPQAALRSPLVLLLRLAGQRLLLRRGVLLVGYRRDSATSSRGKRSFPVRFFRGNKRTGFVRLFINA